MAATSYSKLDSAPIRTTIEQLHDRICERFPDSGLSRVAAELAAVARENETVVEELRRPNWLVRAAAFAVLAVLLGLAAWIVNSFLQIAEARSGTLSDLLQAADSAINEVIFLALAIFFLMSVETRVKRRRALGMIHQLRSLAHILDMHQLTKDPEYVLREVSATASSPARSLTRAQLTRYLEYCSELLALVSKLAALHAQDLQDAVVLEAVNDVETLTADLSRKVWQKITILDVTAAAAQRPS
ncbi:MAG TPA: hypothetical protein VHL59_09540 [Thermoanaerobaculia bacterium]|nr:hypothetical protein [Thermoanaerobaculia bacterium]